MAGPNLHTENHASSATRFVTTSKNPLNPEIDYLMIEAGNGSKATMEFSIYLVDGSFRRVRRVEQRVILQADKASHLFFEMEEVGREKIWLVVEASSVALKSVRSEELSLKVFRVQRTKKADAPGILQAIQSRSAIKCADDDLLRFPDIASAMALRAASASDMPIGPVEEIPMRAFSLVAPII